MASLKLGIRPQRVFWIFSEEFPLFKYSIPPSSRSLSFTTAFELYFFISHFCPALPWYLFPLPLIHQSISLKTFSALLCFDSVRRSAWLWSCWTYDPVLPQFNCSWIEALLVHNWIPFQCPLNFTIASPGFWFNRWGFSWPKRNSDPVWWSDGQHDQKYTPRRDIFYPPRRKIWTAHHDLGKIHDSF